MRRSCTAITEISHSDTPAFHQSTCPPAARARAYWNMAMVTGPSPPFGEVRNLRGHASLFAGKIFIPPRPKTVPMLKCFLCGKGIADRSQAIFRKGKFFGSLACLKKFDQKARVSKGKKNVCEFC